LAEIRFESENTNILMRSDFLAAAMASRIGCPVSSGRMINERDMGAPAAAEVASGGRRRRDGSICARCSSAYTPLCANSSSCVPSCHNAVPKDDDLVGAPDGAQSMRW
jgi:hypothetical protein